MLNNKERRNKMINRHKETIDLLNSDASSIQQKIRKAKNVFVWVVVYDGSIQALEI